MYVNSSFKNNNPTKHDLRNGTIATMELSGMTDYMLPLPFLNGQSLMFARSQLALMLRASFRLGMEFFQNLPVPLQQHQQQTINTNRNQAAKSAKAKV